MIKYDPAKLLRKIAPARKIEKLMSSRLTLKRAALSFVSDIDLLDAKEIEDVALRTIKGYRARVADDPTIKADILDDPAQLIQRVQNEVIFQVASALQEKYSGERYTWLPSSADEPSPEHQLNYGKTFTLGEGDANGEDPGDRYGCQCGMEIQVDASSLDL